MSQLLLCIFFKLSLIFCISYKNRLRLRWLSAKECEKRYGRIPRHAGKSHRNLKNPCTIDLRESDGIHRTKAPSNKARNTA